jgi:hypothetical protein
MESLNLLPDSELSSEPDVLAPPGEPRHCSYKTSTGKPCRYLALPGKVFCKDHVRRLLPDPDALAEELIAVRGLLASPWKVNDVRYFMPLSGGASLPGTCARNWSKWSITNGVPSEFPPLHFPAACG